MPVVLIQRPSPNHNDRPADEISAIVIHADAASKISQSIAWLCDPQSKVSYHVIIGRLGDCYQLVQFDKRAWHAGKSVIDAPEYGHCGTGSCMMDNRQNVNDFSIGICFGNRQDGKEPYTEAEYQAGAELCRELMQRYPAITPERIVTHEHIALPHGRKADPGPLFDFLYFIGLVTR